MMQFAHKHLIGIEGLEFYKLLGTGKGSGFNPLPDWSVYSLLQVWDSEENAELFFERSHLFRKYKVRTKEYYSLYLRPTKVKGEWSGQQPFHIDRSATYQKPLAVLTRATIKPPKLIKFWSYVPKSQKNLTHNPGLIFTKGVGEVPLLQMATFSLWKDEASLKAFAYQSDGHQVAIKKTNELNWYREELFARFYPYKSSGKWNGKDLLTTT